MSSWILMAIYLSAASPMLLLTVSEAQYYDLTPAPDYDDYNATFEYSFYSNGSIEDLDKFSEPFIDDEEEEEDIAGTMTTTQGTTEWSRVNVRNVASLPVSLEIRTLVWTLIILMSLNMQQLQHTL